MLIPNKEAIIRKGKDKSRIYLFKEVNKQFAVYGETKEELDDLLELYLSEYEISNKDSDKYDYVLNKFKLNKDVITVELNDILMYI